MQNVPHSSNFNAIETLWSCAKTHFYKLLLINKVPLTEETFHSLVKKSLDTVSPATHRGILQANRGYIRRYLEETVN